MPFSRFFRFLGFISDRKNLSGRGNRMDPRIEFPPEILPGVGPQFRYDPTTNPYGARGSGASI